MIPRLALDIGWADLASAVQHRGDAAVATRAIERLAPAGTTAVVALSARTAFDALLTALALPAGSEVVASGVNIEGMAEIVRAHGLVLVPVDLVMATLAPAPGMLAAAIGERTRLFLLAHLYGARCETEALAEICRARGVLFVEDCAQAWAGDLELSPGCDVALYSFGPIKFATALGGAVALLRDEVLAASIRRVVEAHPVKPDVWSRRRVWKHAWLKLLSWPPLYGAAMAGLRLGGLDPDAVIGRAARGFPSGALIAQIRHRPPARLLTLLARRLTSGTWRSRSAPPDLTSGVGLPEVPGEMAARHGWWLFPVLSDQPDALVEKLRKAGLDATRGATSLRALARADGEAPPEAARLIASVVYVPVQGGSATRRIGLLADEVIQATRRGAREPWGDVQRRFERSGQEPLARLIATLRKRGFDRSLHALGTMDGLHLAMGGRPDQWARGQEPQSIFRFDPGPYLLVAPEGPDVRLTYCDMGLPWPGRDARKPWSAVYKPDEVEDAFYRFVIRAGWFPRGHPFFYGARQAAPGPRAARRAAS
jgi:perosamine synthetase